MKKSTNRFIRICTPVLCLLLLLPSFSLWAVAEEAQLTENGISRQALESAEALDLQRAELVSDLDEESLIFNYVDRSSFIEAGHVERVCEDEEPNTYVFKNADGSKTVYFLDEDVKYLNAGGEATEKKLDLVALDGGYTTRASNVSLALPNAIASGVTLAYNGNSVTLTPKPRTLTGGTVSAGSALTGTAGASMTADLEAALMEQALQIAPVGIASGKADYQGAFGTGTTLRYTPTLSGVKEDVILDAYRGQNTFAFTLNTGNLSVFEEEGRYFIAPTADAEERILISDTWVYDAAGNFEKGTLSVTQTARGVYTLTIGASVEFLTDENTVYPVYIDPSLTISYGTTGSGYIEDVTVFEGIPNINCGTFLYSTVGYSEDYGRGRTAVRLNGLYNSSIYQTIIDSQITSVKFHVKEASGTDPQNILLYPLESKTWTESGATWNNIGAHSDVSVAEATLENNGLASFDITNLVSWDWKGNAANAQPARDFYQEQGFLMVSADETAVKQICSSEYTNTNLRPYVVMEYTAVLLIDGASSGVLCVEPSGKLQMSAKTYPSDCPVTWSVSDEDVATIDAETGLLTGVSCGQVTVTATAITEDNVTFSGTMRVYVVSVLPGEYHIEDPQQVDGFIESYNGIAQVMTGVSKESRWTVQYYSAGYYTIRSSETGRYLCADITNLSVMLNPASAAGMASRWQFSKTTTGEWIIAPILDSSLCLTADGYDVFLDEYDQASANAYGWIFRTTAFTLANYYDSSLIGQSELLEIIPDACLFVQRVFMDQFGITVNIKSEPVFYEGLEYETCESGDGEDCSECNYCNNVSPLQHHRNTDVIREQLYTETPREFNEVCVLWGHHEVAAFCGTEGGHSLLNIYGYARIGGPVIHIIKMAGSTMEAKKVNMAMTLLHEFVHTFGFSEVYGDYSDTHDDLSCVMGGDYSTQAFRESLYDWYMNDDGDEAIAPFCEECIQKLTGDGLANVYNKYHKEN